MPKDAQYMVNPALATVKDLPRLVMHLNQAFLRIQNRLDKLENIGQKKPATPTGLAAEGRQGSHHVRWNKVVGVTGYILVMASDSAANLIVSREQFLGSEKVYHSFPAGNVATLRYFQIWSYRGNQLSDPSEIVSATSVAYGAGESAPTAPPQTPQSPEREPHVGLLGTA